MALIKQKQQDLAVWGALLLLVVGLGLLDRSFAFWRNDGRNFRMANGEYRKGDDASQPNTWRESHNVQKSMALLGGLMLLTSLGLFTATAAASQKPA